MRVVSKSAAVLIAEARPWVPSVLSLWFALIFAFVALRDVSLGAGLIAGGAFYIFTRFTQFSRLEIDVDRNEILLITRTLFDHHIDRYPAEAIFRAQTETLAELSPLPLSRTSLVLRFRWGDANLPLTGGYFTHPRTDAFTREINDWLGLPEMWRAAQSPL
ncbi:MAG: hypothetical protein AAGD04_10995 [Pseudomonadota bacterium]